MILDGVDVFVKVVQAGGFSAAARQLGMPTTTVSAKIARLESRLGVTLIQRSTRRLHVTAAGENYFQSCLVALKALAEGEEQLSAATDEPAGTLRLTAPSDLAQSLLPEIVHRYVATYPKTEVELIVTNTPLDLIAERIDLAVRASPMQDSSLLSRKYAAGSMALFASRDYLHAHGTPATIKALADHPILVHRSIAAMPMLSRSGEPGFTVSSTARIRADDMQTLRALAREGVGVALLPDFTGTTAEDKTLVRVLPDYASPSAPVFFVYAAQRYVPVNIRVFIDLAQSIEAAR